MKINYKIFGIFLFLIAVGICAGSFFETGMVAGEKSGFFEGLSAFFGDSGKIAEKNNAEGSKLFAENLFSGSFSFLPALGIGFASAFLPFLLPLVPLYIFTCGMSVGFSAAAIFEAFGPEGAAYILTSLLPPHLIRFPVFCFLGMISLQTGFETMAYLFSRRKHAAALRSARKALRADMGKYSAFYLAGSLLIFISCLLQRFLLQAFPLP